MVFLLATFFFWTDSPVGVVSLATMAAGDGLADLIGRRFGSSNKWFFNKDKSMAGSAAFVAGSFVGSYGLLFWLTSLGAMEPLGMGTMGIAGRLLAIAVICAGVELIPVGDDNWSVPISAALLSGTPGNTDNEGFEPYADSVGAGIYGGIVKRHPHTGEIVIGRQYQNHNPRPGPQYAGGGYAPSALVLDDADARLIPLLTKYPDLANDVTTGGAQPLHMCGMSRSKQHAVGALVERGADIEALDTYGMTPLHRMASNNLVAGAAMLLEAGADVANTGKIGATPMSIARDSAATEVMKVLDEAERSSSL